MKNVWPSVNLPLLETYPRPRAAELPVGVSFELCHKSLSSDAALPRQALVCLILRHRNRVALSRPPWKEKQDHIGTFLFEMNSDYRVWLVLRTWTRWEKLGRIRALNTFPECKNALINEHWAGNLRATKNDPLNWVYKNLFLSSFLLKPCW